MKWKISAIFLLFISLSAHSWNRTVRDIHVEVANSSDLEASWYRLTNNPEFNLKRLIELLAKSELGKRILLDATSKAHNYGETLLDVIRPGEGSLTDTTLIRKFSPSNPKNIIYETKSVVYLNKNLGIMDAVLDLAHELTHYAYRKEFNPYRPDFALQSFIESTVEGIGGEVEAYINECKVLYQLFPKHSRKRFHCAQIQDRYGKFSALAGRKEFYKVGQFYRDFKKVTGPILGRGSLPHLSDKEPLFISSAYGKPYPVAAYEEFRSVLSKVCANDRRRLDYMRESMGISQKVRELARKVEQKCHVLEYF